MQNSLELMNDFNVCLQDVEIIKKEMDDIANQINLKLDIINTYDVYTNTLLENLRLEENNIKKDRIIFNSKPEKLMGGNYGLYGQTIHSKFVKMPANIFNFITETGPIYKDNAIVEFYDKNDPDHKDYKYQYSDMLKYETDVSKNDVYKVFSKDTVTMAVQVNIGHFSGGTQFNMIEICPYLPGSFSIEAIRIYSTDQYYKKDMLFADKEINKTFSKIGSMRIALNEKINLYRIEFDIRLHYQLNGFPFGLRHLYFYNADMDSQSDYVIVEVKKDDYISRVGQDIALIKPDGTINTTADKVGIKYYMFYDNNVLQTPLTNPIARNITKFYAKIPLREPLIGIEFKDIETR